MGYEVTISEIHGRTSRQVYHNDVGIEDGKYGIYKMDKDHHRYFVPIGGAVYVEDTITDIDTCEQYMTLYFDMMDGKRRSIRFPREDLNENKITSLTAYGVQVTKQKASVLIRCIENQEIKAKRLLNHNRLGFGVYENRSIFKGAEAVGALSVYRGNLRISPKGSYDTYLQMIKEEVIGHTPAEFLLTASVSGLLVDYLKEAISVENVVIHLVGESSTGKTTGALMAVASGSAPDFLGNNFVFTFQDTLNSLMRVIPSSFPALIDEGSLLSDRDMTQTLYSLCGGVEKKRLTQTMAVNDSSRFRTALFLTSEKSILSQSNNNSGLLVRNFEFVNVVWTKSAESADRIKDIASENYGHIIPKVAKWLLNQKKETIVECVAREVKGIVRRAREEGYYNNLTERSAKQSALILVAVDIVSDVLKVRLNKEAIQSFMEEHSLVNNIEKVSIGIRAMEWLLQVLAKSQTQFIRGKATETGNNCRGRLEDVKPYLLKNGQKCSLKLYVSQTEFINILKEGKFSESQTILKEWKECGYLQAQKDRFISKVTINDFKVKGYVICIPDMDDIIQIKPSVQINTEEDNKEDTESLNVESDSDEDDLDILDDEETEQIRRPQRERQHIGSKRFGRDIYAYLRCNDDDEDFNFNAPEDREESECEEDE